MDNKLYEQLKNFLRTYVEFEEQELDKICRAFKYNKVKKNVILLNQDQICKEVYFVKKGCIRTFFISKQGREKTRLVNLENSIGTSFASFLNQLPSFELIETLEDSELLAINYIDFYRILNEINHWKDFYQKILEMAYTSQNNKIEQLVTLTAKQRYDLVLKENPILLQRLSNKVLASFLDIREETLSRIKSK